LNKENEISPTRYTAGGNFYKRIEKLMGNRFELSVVTKDEHFATSCINKGIEEIKRIEALLTTFNDNSETACINKNAGIEPTKVCKEVFDLIARSLKISELTQGAFDISYGSFDKRFWNFDLNMTELPNPDLAKESVKLINFKNIILNEEDHSVYLKYKGMRIGFGGIGKGYAAEQAKTIMQKAGVENGVVNASGDLTAWGCQPNGNPWTIGIADPNLKQKIFSYLNISGLAVATSGNYEKFVTIKGKRYSHTINPKTGMPVQGIKSVTIICPNAEIADAMATPISVMGTEVGLDLINHIKDIACIIIDENNKIFTSKNINIL
jgi:thiamine biosynthesis lipoprotein